MPLFAALRENWIGRIQYFTILSAVNNLSTIKTPQIRETRAPASRAACSTTAKFMTLSEADAKYNHLWFHMFSLAHIPAWPPPDHPLSIFSNMDPNLHELTNILWWNTPLFHYPQRQSHTARRPRNAACKQTVRAEKILFSWKIPFWQPVFYYVAYHRDYQRDSQKVQISPEHLTKSVLHARELD